MNETMVIEKPNKIIEETNKNKKSSKNFLKLNTPEKFNGGTFDKIELHPLFIKHLKYIDFNVNLSEFISHLTATSLQIPFTDLERFTMFNLNIVEDAFLKECPAIADLSNGKKVDNTVIEFPIKLSSNEFVNKIKVSTITSKVPTAKCIMIARNNYQKNANRNPEVLMYKSFFDILPYTINEVSKEDLNNFSLNNFFVIAKELIPFFSSLIST